MQKESRFHQILKATYVYIVLAVTVVILTLIKGKPFGRGNFLNWSDNLVNLFRMASPVLTVSSGFTLLMISGRIDLSVGSTMSLSSVVYCIMVINGMSMMPAVILTMLLGILLGFCNGLIVTKLNITPVIATLITMNLYQGIARYIVPTGLSAIKSSDTLKMPEWINHFARQDVLAGLPAAFFVAIAVILILVFVQHRSILGKYSAAIGGNQVAAVLSGISVFKIVTSLYVLTGVLAALGGVIRASYMSLGDPLSGSGMEVDCIIAVLLGGTAFTGGEGSVSKTAIGAMIIICVTVGLKAVIPEYWQTFAKGSVLVAAVVLNHLLAREKQAA
jgi:ribose/xylose/arabinose/galactoside ABC-type transport system permease subunit